MPWYSLNNLIAGANDAHYMRFASRRILSLNDITSDPAEDGIFHQIRNNSWNQLPAQSQVLNLDYYYNVSGDKIASKYLQAQAEERMNEETGETYYIIPSSIMTNLGALITLKYQRKWEELWSQYAIQPWFDNVNLETGESINDNESITDDGSISNTGTDIDEGHFDIQGKYVDTTNVDDDRVLTKTGSETDEMRNHEDKTILSHSGSDSLVVAHTGTISDDYDATQTGKNTDTTTYNSVVANTGYTEETHTPSGPETVVLTHTGSDTVTNAHTGTIHDVANAGTNTNTFGFNTVGESGNPTTKVTDTNDTTRTFNNTDTVTTTPGVSDTTTTTLSVKTDRRVDNLSEAKTGMDKIEHDFNQNNTKDNTRTFNNTDTTTTTPGVQDTTTNTLKYDNTKTFNQVAETHSGTYTTDTTREYTGYTKPYLKRFTHGLTRTTGNTRDISRNNVHTTTFAGMDYRRFNRVQELIKLFENPNLFPFFQIVYGDIDEVMCLPVFK